MAPVQVAGLLASAIVSILFVRSSISKIWAKINFLDVLHQLGIRRVYTWRIIIIGIEFSVAVIVLLPVSPLAPAIGIVFLAAMFAIAGLRALTYKHTIECACFGNGNSGKLGWRQILAFPLWILAALAILAQGTPGPRESIVLAATVMVLSIAVYLIETLRAIGRAHRTWLVMAEIGSLPR